MRNSFTHPVITGVEIIASRETAMTLCSITSVQACLAAQQAGLRGPRVVSIEFTFVNEGDRTGNVVRTVVTITETPSNILKEPRLHVETHVWRVTKFLVGIVPEYAEAF